MGGVLHLSDEIQHLLKAEHNERLLGVLQGADNTQEFIDWCFVILYYTALHFGDAYLAKKGIISINSHSERIKKYQKKLPSDAFISYKKLEARSRIARYEPENSYTLTQEVFDNLQSKDFMKIKSLI